MRCRITLSVLVLALLCPRLSHAAQSTKTKRAHPATKARTTQKARATRKVAAQPTPIKLPRVTPTMLRGKIVFAQDEDLWAMNPDGKGRFKILAHSASCSFGSGNVALSPDLSHIALTCEDPKHTPYSSEELFVMALDESHKQQLTHHNYTDAISHPRFSPDGKRLVYEDGSGKHWGGPMTYHADLYIVDVDGNHLRRLTGNETYNPYWSRDGKRIYYTRIKGGIYEGTDIPRDPGELWSINVDGSDEKASIGQEAQALNAGVSPDAKWLVTRKQDSNSDVVDWRNGELMLRNMVTGEEKRLTTNANLEEVQTVWSPNSRYLAFTGLRWFVSGNQLELWVSDTEGLEPRPLLLNASVIAWMS